MDKTIQRILILVLMSLLGLGIGAAGSVNGALVGEIPVFGLVILVAFLIQVVAFFPAYLLHTEKFYDLSGTVTYTLGTLLVYFTAPEPDLRTTIMAIFILVWTLRLGYFLFRRVLKAGEDTRFREIVHDPLGYLVYWVIQGLWVSLTAAAVWTAMSSSARVELEAIGIIGIILWLVGFGIEVVSDSQKTKFKTDPENKGKFINVGLWSRSRHPNYFGEIVLWIGMALIALPVLSGLQYITLISPIFVIILLTRVSGIPILEKQGDERWGGQEDYEEYKKNVPVLIPKLF